MKTAKAIDSSKKLKKDSKALVARYARGNVSLQIGRFVTAEEKEERKKAVLSVKFS